MNAIVNPTREVSVSVRRRVTITWPDDERPEVSATQGWGRNERDARAVVDSITCVYVWEGPERGWRPSVTVSGFFLKKDGTPGKNRTQLTLETYEGNYSKPPTHTEAGSFGVCVPRSKPADNGRRDN